MKAHVVAVVASAFAVSAMSGAYAADKTHDGKVVSATAEKLVMTSSDGKEHSHKIAADAKVTLDGKAAKATDLKKDMRIRVTTKADDATIATKIEAIDKNPDFAK